MTINFPFYCGAGGVGDFLLSITTFYDDVESANIIWFADNKSLIEEVANFFPKLKNKCIFTKDDKFAYLWRDITDNKNCLSTCITPKNLDYSEWYKVNIFEKYGVKENPKFIKDLIEQKFYPFKNDVLNQQINTLGIRKDFDDYICIMPCSSRSEYKTKIILQSNIEKIINDNNTKIYLLGKETLGLEKKYENIIDATQCNILNQMNLICYAKKVYSVDSWVKTWSALNQVDTYCFDNIYSNGNYLNSFKDNIDYGHYVFIFPFKKITFIKQ